MYIYYSVLFQLFFLHCGKAEDEKQCEANQRKLATLGVCSDGDEYPCADLCSGAQIMGGSDCATADHCCFRGGKCVIKRIDKPTDNGMDIDKVGRHFFQNFTGRPIQSRTFVPTPPPIGITQIQSLFPGVTLCPKFPESCSLTYRSPDDLQPPLNIPYCRRIPCRSDDPFLDQNPVRCLMNPGCAFDHQLYVYRRVLSQAIFIGVPVCHLVIRNEAFQTLALNYTQQTGLQWNPLLTNCFIDHYRERIHAESRECSMTRVLGELGHQAKRAGWSGISRRDCLLINGCWLHEVCIYPLPLNNIKTKAVERQGPNTFFLPFGRHMCLPFSNNLTNGDFLDAYHGCLSSGCSLDVDRETVLRHIHGVASTYLPRHLQPQYWTMALLGQVQAHNWKEVADRLIRDNRNSPTNVLSEILPKDILGGATLHGGAVSVLPFTLAINLNSSSILGNSFTTFGSFGQFGNVNPPGSSVTARRFRPGRGPANVANRLNLGNFGSLLNPKVARTTTWKSLQDSLLGKGPPSDGRRSAFPGLPCPYQSIQWPGFPPLTGSFQDCCKIPMCYLPRIAIRNVRSEIASYLTEWTSWGPCSKSCGNGQQTRRQFCVGDNCDDVKQEAQQCNSQPCSPLFPTPPFPTPPFPTPPFPTPPFPTPPFLTPPLLSTPPFPTPPPVFTPPFPTPPPLPSGRTIYSEWSQYSNCDVTCGGGTKRRTRICLVQGDCSGPLSESEPCKTGRCPRFKRTPWSPCSTTCGIGKQQRRINCVRPGPYGCPINSNPIEERECESFCGQVTFLDSSCNQTTCVITRTPRCMAENGGRGHCRASEMKVKKKKCFQGRCFCVRNRRVCRNRDG